MSRPDPEVIRPILSLRDETDPTVRAQVDICRGGLVRLRLLSGGEARDLFCDTLEDLAWLAAAEPELSGDLYGRLVWELDLLGLQGDG